MYYNDKEFTTIAFGEDALKEYADNLTKENLFGWDKTLQMRRLSCFPRMRYQVKGKTAPIKSDIGKTSLTPGLRMMMLPGFEAGHFYHKRMQTV